MLAKRFSIADLLEAQQTPSRTKTASSAGFQPHGSENAKRDDTPVDGASTPSSPGSPSQDSAQAKQDKMEVEGEADTEASTPSKEESDDAPEEGELSEADRQPSPPADPGINDALDTIRKERKWSDDDPEETARVATPSPPPNNAGIPADAPVASQATKDLPVRDSEALGTSGDGRDRRGPAKASGGGIQWCKDYWLRGRCTSRSCKWDHSWHDGIYSYHGVKERHRQDNLPAWTIQAINNHLGRRKRHRDDRSARSGPGRVIGHRNKDKSR